jgi:type II secretory pathway component PulF
VSARLAERLDALADALAAGAGPAEALALVQAASPDAARWAAKMSGPVGAGIGLASALAQAEPLRPAEIALLRTAERSGSVGPALRWIAGRRRARRERWAGVVQGTFTLMAMLVLTNLTSALPAIVLGGNFGAAVAPGLLGTVAGLLAVYVGVPMALRHPKVAGLLAPVPGPGHLVRLQAEAELAAAAAALVEAGGSLREGLAGAADVVRVPSLSAAAREGLGLVAPDGGQRARRPRPVPAGVASEPLRLALVVGDRAGDLPTRMRAFAAAAEARVTSRLVVALRITLLIVIVLLSLQSLLGSFAGPAGMLDLGGGGLPLDPGTQREFEQLMKEIQ